MKNKKVFCYECREDITYTVEEEEKTGKLKGKVYSYIGRGGQCDNCKAEVYVPEIDDFNLKALYDVYRKDHNIISIDDIAEIPALYNIGKRPLSLLLGWGEQTFSRYLDGDMPTKQYSDLLKRIHEDPEVYSEILEGNKDNLKSNTAYIKSRKKIDELLESRSNGSKKIDEVIDYTLYWCEDITPLSLQKILYYIQGFYYAFYNSYYFEDECEAWVHGPVYRDIYHRYSQYHFDPIDGPKEVNTSGLTTAEITVLDSVIKNLACYSGKTLEKFTHSEEPWIRTRGDLPAGIPSNRLIKKEVIGSYFTAVRDKFNMLTPVDIKAYSEAMFDQM